MVDLHVFLGRKLSTGHNQESERKYDNDAENNPKMACIQMKCTMKSKKSHTHSTR